VNAAVPLHGRPLLARDCFVKVAHFRQDCSSGGFIGGDFMLMRAGVKHFCRGSIGFGKDAPRLGGPGVPGEGFKRPWQPLIKMDGTVKAKVEKLFDS
jgi:hypothetical protein